MTGEGAKVVAEIDQERAAAAMKTFECRQSAMFVPIGISDADARRNASRK